MRILLSLLAVNAFLFLLPVTSLLSVLAINLMFKTLSSSGGGSYTYTQVSAI
jgi:hypothetical protein